MAMNSATSPCGPANPFAKGPRDSRYVENIRRPIPTFSCSIAFPFPRPALSVSFRSYDSSSPAPKEITAPFRPIPAVLDGAGVKLVRG